MSKHVSPVKIADIRQGMRNLTIVGRIAEIGEVQMVVTKFGQARAAAATLEDQTGSIRLNLWRDQIDKVRVADSVKLENAFVRVFNFQNELNIGRDGKISVLDRS
jgi:ssDNA-binding replication factor A large subunit